MKIYSEYATLFINILIFIPINVKKNVWKNLQKVHFGFSCYTQYVFTSNFVNFNNEANENIIEHMWCDTNILKYYITCLLLILCTTYYLIASNSHSFGMRTATTILVVLTLHTTQKTVSNTGAHLWYVLKYTCVRFFSG